MTGIWDERPKTKSDGAPYEYWNTFYDEEEMDVWFEKVKSELDKLEAIKELLRKRCNNCRFYHMSGCRSRELWWEASDEERDTNVCDRWEYRWNFELQVRKILEGEE